MSGVSEKLVQDGICERLSELGWELTLNDAELGRPVD